MNQQIKTWLGTVIIVIIAATTFSFVWIYAKNNSIDWQNDKFLVQPKKAESADGFCGRSTYDSCNSNEDCVEVGCSSEICSGKNYKGDNTISCLYKSCAHSRDYNLNCGCAEGRCQWAESKNLVGNDRDEHGCIGSAGYSWCEEKQKCLRSWEESCDEIDTSGWKTYKNEKYGFEFKYPKETKITDVSREIDGSEDKCIEIDLDFGSINIAVPKYDYPCGRTGVGNEYDVVQNLTEIIKIGKTEYKATGLKEFEKNIFNNASFWVTLSNNIQIQYNYGNLRKSGIQDDYADGQRLVNQILSTFKFIK